MSAKEQEYPMAWSKPTVKLVDQVALQGAEELLGISRARLARNPDAADELSHPILGIFSELWPTARHTDRFAYLITIERDIDKMPTDLLEDLTAALSRHARELRRSDPVASNVSQLISNWLKMRSVELRSDAQSRKTARILKSDHMALFKQILCEMAEQDTELAS